MSDSAASTDPANSADSANLSTPQIVVLIDGHALAFRSYYGIGRDLVSSKGHSTKAIVGFMRVLLRELRQAEQQVIVTFDPPTPTFRHEQYPQYKAGRSAMPDDLAAQIDALRQIVDALGVPRLEVVGYEADDVIGSLSTRAHQQGLTVHIITSDRDTYQLLTMERVYVLGKGNTLIGSAEVKEEYGISVEQWLDFRALTGDSSDNIPGAKGIGKVTAAKILQQYGDLSSAYAAAKEGTLKPDGVRKKLLASEENVQLSHQLSQMFCQLELEVELGQPLGKGDPQRLHELLEELELVSIAAEINKLRHSEGKTDQIASDSQVQPLAPIQAQTQPPLPAADWQPPSHPDIVWGYQLAREDDLEAPLLAAAYVDVLQPTQHYSAPTSQPAIWQELEAQYQPPDSLFASEAYSDEEQSSKAQLSKTQQRQQEKSAQRAAKALAQAKAQHPAYVEISQFANTLEINAANAKALAKHLQFNQLLATPADDPLLLAYLLDPANNDMAKVTRRYLGQDWPSEPSAVGQRATLSWQLLQQLPPLLSEQQKTLYHEMEKPLANLLTQMELRGVCLDAAYLRGLSEALGQQLQQLESQIYQYAGRQFAIRSRDQLETVLYDELGLESGKKTKLTKKRSTAVSALEPLREEHPIIPLLLEFRELEKLRNTYLDPLPKLVNAKTGRLHTTFQQTAVATGRLSSLNPNLQNIPMRTEIGRQIRKSFVASEGFLLISADYSQIELRLLAHIADDQLMQQAFAEGADIHRRTAAQIFAMPEEDISSEQRRAAKTINFGVLYGMSAHRLSKELAIPYARASQFIESYFASYPNIQRYIEETLEFGRQHGYVQTIYGRRRYVDDLSATNRTTREASERLAYNMPIQGSAADIIKLAMVQLASQLEPLGAHLLLQVHDELLIEAPADKSEQVAELTQQVMQEVVELEVPLVVEYGIGESWYSTK